MRSAEPFVPTSAIRDAVKGRELDILKALGIPWPDGSTHIRCPYPDHVDENPSWRWDLVKAQAHCTCTSSASIFDVIGKLKGCDFAEAKLVAAGLIGQPDLIRQRGRKKNKGEGCKSPVTTLQHRNTHAAVLSQNTQTQRAKRRPLGSFGISEIHYLSKPALRSAFLTLAPLTVRRRLCDSARAGW